MTSRTANPTGIPWMKYPGTFPPSFTSDGEVAATMRWGANHPQATEEELQMIVSSHIVPDDVYETCMDRLKEEFGWGYEQG